MGRYALKSESAFEKMQEHNKELEAEVERLREAAKAYQDLSVCYRLGKRPTEKLFTRLVKAKEALETQ